VASEEFCQSLRKTINDCIDKEFIKMENIGFKLESRNRNDAFTGSESNEKLSQKAIGRYLG